MSRVQEKTAIDGAERGELLSIRNLAIGIKRRHGSTALVRGVSLSLQPGSRIAIVGESGAGKSLTARAVAGLVDPRRFVLSGEVLVSGKEVIGLSESEARRNFNGVALVFQDSKRTLNPTMRVGLQVAEAVTAVSGASKHEVKSAAVELLRVVGIADPEERYFNYPHQMSGGMRQRIVIAIALAMQPVLLLADEATTALDVTTQALIMDLLQDLVDERKMGLVFITHDVALAASSVDEVYVMYAGRIVEHAATAELIEHPKMPYTQALLAAMPDISEDGLPAAIVGQPPDPAALPSGCPFRERCPFAFERCSIEEPPLLDVSSGHSAACWLV